MSTTQSETESPILLHQLLSNGIIPSDGWETLTPHERETLNKIDQSDKLAEMLGDLRLVTPFQAEQIAANKGFRLILGNYRILEKLTDSNFSQVFRGEHRRLRTPCAIKTLRLKGVAYRSAIDRFFQEVRAVSMLKHPNLLRIIDAGEEELPGGETLSYLVSELLASDFLEDFVQREGPLDFQVACQIARQIADALVETHRNGLVHRNINPSNILISKDRQVKLVDFGLANLSLLLNDGFQEGELPERVSFLAPELRKSLLEVDPRIDVYGLGATLFYMLTGHAPPRLTPLDSLDGSSVSSARLYQPELPEELDQLIMEMLAEQPAKRLNNVSRLLHRLTPFSGVKTSASATRVEAKTVNPNELEPSVLIVDDEEPIRRVVSLALASDQIGTIGASTGIEAWELIQKHSFDLIILDVDLPGLNGPNLLNMIRENPPSPNIKVLMLSGRAVGDTLAQMLYTGADDYLVKPFSVVQLRARIKNALRMKAAQDRNDMLSRQLAENNLQLERLLSSQTDELVHARGAMVLAMATLVGHRSTETGGHLIRIQRYSRVLATSAATIPAFSESLTPEFIHVIEAAAPLHDIGKVAVPDQILHKPGPLTAEERLTMQEHTTIGADTLANVSLQYPFATSFFQVAIDITRHHHERWDGNGYPDRLSGISIPLSARVVAIADVYDALRSRRVYKDGFGHQFAVEQIVEHSPGHFDPALVSVFKAVHQDFDRIFEEMKD